jgi:hypothetical protein
MWKEQLKSMTVEIFTKWFHEFPILDSEQKFGEQKSAWEQKSGEQKSYGERKSIWEQKSREQKSFSKGRGTKVQEQKSGDQKSRERKSFSRIFE